MTERILCVDDEPNILQAYQRQLRKRFSIEIALGGEEALDAVKNNGPFAVIVSDMRMPVINGVDLLKRVKTIAPETVRMMLTGNSDQQTALEAVNDGHVFRFMTKPCPPDVFAKALEAGLEQHQLIVAEHELLSKTLSGSIQVLTDVLTLVNPTAFGRASRVQRLARDICGVLGSEEGWLVNLAAMLSQIGCVAVPEDILEKAAHGTELSKSETNVFQTHPAVARDLLRHIPRLERVAEVVYYQEKRFDGGGVPEDEDISGDDIPFGARVLKVALDFDTLLASGCSAEMSLAEMNDWEGCYDPDVLAALRNVMNVADIKMLQRTNVSSLADGMILAADVKSINGTLLCTRGQEVTASLRARLRNYVANVGIQTPIKVFIPNDEHEYCEAIRDAETL